MAWLIHHVIKRFWAMESRFKKYELYVRENGKIVDASYTAMELADEAFLLFKSLYDTNYGTIDENDNLVAIHTGGWSENEELIEEFKESGNGVLLGTLLPVIASSLMEPSLLRS